MFAQVIVDVIHEQVDRPFTYLVPDTMTITEGTRVLVPFGPRQVEGLVIALSDTMEDTGFHLKSILRPLETYPAVLPPLLSLARELAAHNRCPLAETLRLMIPADMRGSRIKEKTEATAQLAFPAEQVEEACEKNKRAPKRVLVLHLLADGAPHTVNELGQLVKNPTDALHALQKMGLVTLTRQPVFRTPYTLLAEQKVPDPRLTTDQEAVLQVMLPAMQNGQGRFLLHGVTGSGKTEVYIRLVRACLENGKGAIILVPEIALTPQMVSWFRSRFGPGTAVLHSRLTPGQRFDEWRRIRMGQARVVIGARSAIFAPVENLGLIVVDEEHEASYQSDSCPHYDARDVALSRADREGAAVLLASATPSILSFAKAMRGDYTLLEMPNRVNARPLPEVTVVDMRLELAGGNRSIFSALLYGKLKACLQKGQQAILFLNRRGHSPFVSCRACGYTVKCPNCDIAMTYHQQRNGTGLLKCHYCGQELAPPTRCPQCGSGQIRYFGIGTQKVEEEVHKLFPDAGVVRMDADTTTAKDGHAKLLEEFRTGHAQILIGTQMIAKGLDFPRVTLVGVIAADMTLNLPDYRSQERTFQLLTQVAGRAGRAKDVGEVIVQTYQPDHPVILAARSQDFRAFFHDEFQRRRTGLYPPFTMLLRLLVENTNAQEAAAAAKSLYDTCQKHLENYPDEKKRVLFMRLDDAPVKMIRGKTRKQVLIKCFENEHVQPFVAFLGELALSFGAEKGVFLEINPQSLM